MAPGSPPDDPARGLVPCLFPPRMLHSGLSFLTYSLRCLGRSNPWHRVHPRTIQSGGYCCASCRPGCSYPGRLFIVFSPLPRTLQSVAPVSPPDFPVRGLVPCFFPPRMLQSWSSFYRIPSVASDAPVRGTRFTPGRSSPGASAVLLSAPDAPNRAVVLSYSLGCFGRSSPGCLFIVFSPLPRTLQSVAPGSPPDDPVWGLAPCFLPPRMLQSGASFCHILSAASDAPVCGTGFTPGRSSPGASAVLLPAPDAPIRGVFLSYSPSCHRRSSPRHRVHPRTIQPGGLCRASFRPGCSIPGRFFNVFSPLPRTL